MISLYESILSSTKSGAAKYIKEWVESDPYNILKGKYRIEQLDGKWMLIFDDFERQPSQPIYEFNADRWKTVPNVLSGIYYTKYASKNSKPELIPCRLVFTNITGKVDLSKWDMSQGRTNILEIQIDFRFPINNLEITGLPKYNGIFNTWITSGFNCDLSMKNVDSPLCDLSHLTSADKKVVPELKLKNCKLRTYIITIDTFTHDTSSTTDIPYYKIGRTNYIYPKYNYVIDELLENNTIQVIRYQGTNYDAKTLERTNGYKIVPIKKSDALALYDDTKYRIIPL